MATNVSSMKVIAKQNIKKGDEITIQYTSPSYGHLKRKSTLKQNWYFDCTCPRCTDPTEMKTMFSALKCSNCQDCYMLPLDSMNLDSLWQCQSCNFSKSVEDVAEIIKDYEQVFEDFHDVVDVEYCERLLEDLSSKFHANHHFGKFRNSNLIHLKNTIAIFRFSPQH